MSGTLSGAGGIGGLLSATVHSSPSVTHYYAYNGNGDVVCTINCADGTISAHYEYDPFGRLVYKEGSYADDNEYGFSTKRYNVAWSLYDYGYRHYSPDLGRWTSRDQMGEAAGEFPENGQNIYSYVGNAPCDRFDLLGLSLGEPRTARAISSALYDLTHSSETAPSSTPSISISLQHVSINPTIVSKSKPRHVEQWNIKIKMIITITGSVAVEEPKCFLNGCDYGVSYTAGGAAAWTKFTCTVTPGSGGYANMKHTVAVGKERIT